MNLLELAESLPNGLHDAVLHRLVVDCEDRTAILEVDLWIAEEMTPREMYRRAQITLGEVESLIIEPPDPARPFAPRGVLTIDLSPADPPVPAGFRLFVYEWNAFIRGVAFEAKFEWCGAATVRDA